jgi:hypothetical protein
VAVEVRQSVSILEIVQKLALLAGFFNGPGG